MFTTNALRPLLQTALLGLLLSLALGLNYLHAWTNPTAAPTGGNASAPINTGTTAQVKDGNLSVGNSANTTSNIGLSVIGSQYIDGWLKVGDGASGAATQPLELTGTAGTHGIKFPDGTTQTTAAVSSGGTVVKVASQMFTNTANGTVAIPYDDTIPQNTEGTEFMTLSFTPTSASNNLLVQVVFNGLPEAGTATDEPFTVALFRDSVANALAAVSTEPYGFELSSYAIPLTYVMPAGGTSAITFRIRAGVASVGPYRFNGAGGARKFGGVMASSITVTEFKP